MTLSFITLSSVTLFVGSTARFPADYGNFVYVSNDPSPVRMTFNATSDGYGKFSIQCGYRRYEDGPFPLRRDPEEIEYGEVHAFPEGYDVRHQTWLAHARWACPHLEIADEDFSNFYADNNGDLETELGGEYTVLKREWLPLSRGRYLTDPSKSSVKIQYDVTSPNFAYVKFGCDTGDTGFMPYRLVSQGPGKQYTLAAYPGRNTVDDLVRKFKAVCPVWADSFDFDGNFRTVGAATPGVLYAFGDYIYDRLIMS